MLRKPWRRGPQPLRAQTARARCSSRGKRCRPSRARAQVQAIERGGYVLRGGDEPADVVIIATGSEVQLAMRAAALLANEGIRCASSRCPASKCSSASRRLARRGAAAQRAGVAVEAGVTRGWWHYAGAPAR